MTSEEDSPSSNPSSADFRRLLAPLRFGRPKDAPSGATPLSLAQARTLIADSQPAPLLLPALPQTIDRFILLERLGEGGMGVVFAAYDPKLDRKVALKLIHEVRREDGERRQRMEREAQAMAKLSHPNVVTVYEVGDFETRLYLVMEFVKGSDLRGWLTQRAGTVGWRVILETFIQAGNGLAAAHKAGLVHRDFKPDNVSSHAHRHPRRAPELDRPRPRRPVHQHHSGAALAALLALAARVGCTLGLRSSCSASPSACGWRVH